MTRKDKILVGGIQPLTMIDFPGKLASVIFVNGCNLRCRYCHNHDLLASGKSENTSWHEVIEFLKNRQGFIEGVVFSGGEPCLQEGIVDAMTEVRNLGFELALHTNGFFPNIVKKVLRRRLVSYIAVDFKASFNQYEKTVNAICNIESYKKTVELIVKSGINYEFRTTVHPDLISESEIVEIATYLKEIGVRKYVLQKFQYGRALDKSLAPISNYWLSESVFTLLKSLFADFQVRGDLSFMQRKNIDTAVELAA